MVAKAEPTQIPLEYPEHDALDHEELLISKNITTDYINQWF